MLKCIIFMYKFLKENVYSKIFFSQIFTGECIYKIFSIAMYVQNNFLDKKKVTCTKILIFVQNFKR